MLGIILTLKLVLCTSEAPHYLIKNYMALNNATCFDASRNFALQNVNKRWKSRKPWYESFRFVSIKPSKFFDSRTADIICGYKETLTIERNHFFIPALSVSRKQTIRFISIASKIVSDIIYRWIYLLNVCISKDYF